MMTNNEAIGILGLAVETAKGRCFVTDEAISDAYDMAVKALKDAQPERKKGCKIVKGTGHYGYCACDQCGKPVHPEDKFCSKCGADFREEDT